VDALLAELSLSWELVDDVKMRSRFTFLDFKEAWDFGAKVVALAEAENHHPTISISWGKLTVTQTTHAIKGLSENDFIMAAKIDRPCQMI